MSIFRLPPSHIISDVRFKFRLIELLIDTGIEIPDILEQYNERIVAPRLGEGQNMWVGGSTTYELWTLLDTDSH